MRCFPGYILLLAAFVLVRCSIDNLAGGGSDLPDKVVAGKIYSIDKLPAANTQVAFIPIRYNSISDGPIPAALIDTTDSSGVYRINRCPAGDYNIQAVHLYRRTRLLIAAVTVAGDTTSVPADTLRPPGAVKVMLPAGADAVNGYVYVPGTFCFTRLKSGFGFVILDSVPVCKYADIAYGTIDAPGTEVLRYGVSVKSNETSSVWNPGWGHCRALSLNTSVTGAGVTGSVVNFPVLIRFTKQDNTFLSYEIERWDPIGKRAEIWVKVDTIYGNDSSQAITMYWGNINAPAQSNSTAVFDTTEGFIGVWHLAEAGTNQAADATVHRYDGTPTDTAPQSISGVIGSALQFDGNVNGLVMKNTTAGPLIFPRPGTYTFSVWVSVDSVYDEDEFIAGKGVDQYALRIKGSKSIPANMFALHEYIDAPLYETDMRYAPVILYQWKYMVGIRDTAGSYLYIDGTCVDSTGKINQGRISFQGSTNFSIGRCGASFASTTNANDYLPFKGKIDEVRIDGVARTADWVKLCYMNQKPEGRLIKFTK